MLNFLADELRKDEPRRWVVVNFNAWRHQRIVPPWWWLMTTLYSEAVRELDTFDRRRALAMRLREWFWRVRGGWPGYAVLVLGAGVLVAVWQAGFLHGLDGAALFSVETLKGFVIAAAAIITPALTIWAFVRGVSRWVFATSARGARKFIDNTRDPMRLVHEHVRELVHWTGYDVVILIDDLDRCKAPFVVELLEGIQTLFRDAPITYVVAADRDWLSDSYAAEYKRFVSAADEPGRPLGYLFLEKTFQISTGLPPGGAQLDAFWSRLLRSPSLPSEVELEQARATAQSALSGQPADEARRQVAAHPGATPADVQARLETIAVEMASERAAEEAAHTLEPFRSLLGREPNPREMKRLVNAYGIARGMETLRARNLEADHVQEQQTALWTILNLRWPKLGAHLAKHPEHVKAIGNGKPPPEVPRDLLPLFGNREVITVIRGDAPNVVAHLDAETISSVVLA
jgi:KAP family P-loop domain